MEGKKDRGRENKITPLSSEVRKEFPNVIYEQITDSQQNHSLVSASYAAMRETGFPIALDLEQDEKRGVYKVSVRTKESNRREMAGQGALFLGLNEATRMSFGKDNDNIAGKNKDASSYYDRALTTSRGLLHGLIDQEGLFNEFKDYYGGLGWGTDQERFVRRLFEYGTDYDESFVKSNIDGNFLGKIVYELDLAISYDERGKWYKADAKDVLKKYPELDYRKLKQDEFRSSNDGQRLLQAYTRISGEVLSDRYYRGERTISFEGVEISKPLIPLSRFPIIEALMCDEVSMDRPKPKYSFGRSDIIDEIAHSDSEAAHEALVRGLCVRLPQNQRHVFDGPDEFQHKSRNIWSILRAYEEYRADDPKRSLLRHDILLLLEEYTGQGKIAQDVRQEYLDRMSRDGEKYAPSSFHTTKEIVGDLLTVALASPDGDLVGRAQEIIETYLPKGKMEIVDKIDPLALSRANLMLIVFDSLKEVSSGSNTSIFSVVGAEVFDSQAIGDQLAEFARTQEKISNLRNQPEVLLALRELRRFGLSLNDKSPEEVAARSVYEDLSRPSNNLSEQLRNSKNDFLIDSMKRLVGGELSEMDEKSQKVLFSGLLKRIEMRNYNMRVLPGEYYALIEIAKNPGVNEGQRGEIVWHIAQQLEYVGGESTHLLMPVIHDIYELMLGPEGEVKMPTDESYHGLAAATFLVRKHGREIFKSASPEDLKLLESYAAAIQQRARKVASGELLSDQQLGNIDRKEFAVWQGEALKTLKYTMNELTAIGEYYREYMQIEAVKVRPDIYYPWLLQHLVPFWQKMQWEVGPGNRPRGDIQHLYHTIESYVKDRLVIREEYPENFDALRDGNLDTFLLELYNQMILNHDIKYNSTVWNEGLTFMHMAVAYMPEVVIQQIENKHPESGFAKYVRGEHERWNKD